MADYDVTYLAGGTAAIATHQNPTGLGGGYFADLYFPAFGSTTVELRTASSPSAPVMTSGTVTQVATMAGDQGNVYASFRDSAGTVVTLYHVTLSGSTLTLGSVGGYSAPATYSSMPNSESFLVDGAAQYMGLAGQSSPLTYIVAIDTATGSLGYRASITTASHDGIRYGPARVDRFIHACSTHSDFELFDSSGTLLTSVSLMGVSPDDVVFTALPRHRAAFFDGTSGTWGVLDCSTDTIAWESGPTSLPTFSGQYPTISSWGDLVAIGPHGTPTATTYAGLSTGTLTESTTTSSNTDSQSVSSGGFADAEHLVKIYDVMETFLVSIPFIPPAVVTYLRQRQSPRGGAPRVSWGWL